MTTRAQIDVCRIGCALERFRLAHGRFPERLAELEPAWMEMVPRDPFTHDEMIYRRASEGDAFKLYSVGNNRRDDGGQVDSRRSVFKQDDVLWLYPSTPSVTP